MYFSITSKAGDALRAIHNINNSGVELKIINIDEDKTNGVHCSSDCQQLIDLMTDYYAKVGFNKPWAGYFVVDNNQVMGTGGFRGQPKAGKVEISYWTFKEFEGQGIGSFSCKELIAISKQQDPAITITAKTAPLHNASTRILQKNGFEFSETVQDHEIGDAWLWILKPGECNR